MYNRSFVLIASFIVAFNISITGCFSKEDSKKTTAATDTSNTAINSSIINLPKSLSTQPGVKKRFTRSGSNEGMAGVYYGVTQYIGFAEMIKNMGKELLLGIVKDEILNNSVKNAVTAIDPNPNDPGAPKYYMIENPQGEAYEWKISLYFTSPAAPEMIIRFTIVDGTARGRILWSMAESIEDLAAVGITLSKTVSLDVAFDATGTKKTMEIRFIQDLETAYLPYLNTTAWSALTEAQKTAFDLGQPTKVFVNAEFENGVYTIYGTSYHALWDDEAALRGQGVMWDDPNRNIYMFKAKAIEGEGARLYLALPSAPPRT